MFIYPKDVMKIHGKTHRTAQRWIARVKQFYNKQLISVLEYCQFYNLEECYVRQHMVY